MNTFFEKVDVPLKESEIRERGQAMAGHLRELDNLREAKKAAVADYRDQEKELKEKIDLLALQIRSGREPRDVECKEQAAGAGMVEVVRLDGIEPKVVRTRAMTEDEIRDARQGKLFALDGGRKKPKDNDGETLTVTLGEAAEAASKKKGNKKSGNKEPQKLEDAPDLAPEEPGPGRERIEDKPKEEPKAEPAAAAGDAETHPATGQRIVRRRSRKGAAAPAPANDAAPAEDDDEGNGDLA